MKTLILRNALNVAHAVTLLNQLAFDKHPWELIIKRYVKKRSLPQNSLMWDWYTIIGNEIGYEKDEVHDVLREKFLPWHEVEVCGIKRKVLTSTSSEDFTTAMMAEYLEKIDRFANQELGIRLPHPEDRYREEQAARF